jgi:type I restriction enzyme M protein
LAVSLETKDVSIHWQEICQALDRSRSQLESPSGEFLRILASFVVLQHAELEEMERAALASSDDQDYQSMIPNDVHWSQIAEAPNDMLFQVVDHVWKKLERMIAAPRLTHLCRIPSAAALSPGADAVIDIARRVVCNFPGSIVQNRLGLSQIFERAIALHAKSAKYTAEFASDDNLVQLVVDLAAPRIGERIYDPCFGFGGFLSAAAQRVLGQVESPPSAALHDSQNHSLCGVEINSSAWLIGFARMILAGVALPNLELGNALDTRASQLGIEGFDVVMASVPFGYKVQPTGEPRANGKRIETRFVRHILDQLKVGGAGGNRRAPQLSLQARC